jgi:hypothetical protein
MSQSTPVLGNVEPFPAHLLIVLAILGGFSRAGLYRILFGFGDGLLVPPQQSASRRHGKSFPDTPGADGDLHEADESPHLGDPDFNPKLWKTPSRWR